MADIEEDFEKLDPVIENINGRVYCTVFKGDKECATVAHGIDEYEAKKRCKKKLKDNFRRMLGCFYSRGMDEEAEKLIGYFPGRS